MAGWDLCGVALVTSRHPRAQVHVAQDIRCGIFSCDSDLEDQCLQLCLQTTCRTRCLETVEEQHRRGRLSYCREPAWICDRQQHLHARQHRAWSPWWGGRQETQVQGQRGLYNETLVQETKTVAETHCPSGLCKALWSGIQTWRSGAESWLHDEKESAS